MRVAVIGASAHREKYGNKAVRSYVAQGHEVLPVNPHLGEVEGLKAYSRITDIPGDIDRALLYVPPQIGIQVLSDIAAKGVKEVFVNPGAESDALFEEAAKLGISTVFACGIVDIGDSPSKYGP